MILVALESGGGNGYSAGHTWMQHTCGRVHLWLSGLSHIQFDTVGLNYIRLISSVEIVKEDMLLSYMQ